MRYELTQPIYEARWYDANADGREIAQWCHGVYTLRVVSTWDGETIERHAVEVTTDSGGEIVEPEYPRWIVKLVNDAKMAPFRVAVMKDGEFRKIFSALKLTPPE